MLSGGTTLLFVSHNIQTVKNLCDNAIWLDKGVVRMAGPSAIVCDAYKAEQDRIAREKKEEKRRKLREAARSRMTIWSWAPDCMVRCLLQR